MRALVVEPGPSFSVQDVCTGIIGGLRANGVHVESTNLGERISFYAAAMAVADPDDAFREKACRMACQGIKVDAWDLRPDIAIIVSSFFVPPDIYTNLRERGVHVVAWFTECPYEDERHLPIARFADTVIVNDPMHLDRFRAVNPRTWYIPHAYDPAVHHSTGRTDQHPFCVVGTGYPSRVEFLERTGLPAGSVLAGNWQAVPDDSPLHPFLHPSASIANSDAADLYRASITSANLYRKEAMAPELVDGWAIGPREVELAACGVWFAREPRGEGDELFPLLPTFTTPDELSEQITWALANPASRDKAVRAAREAIADRTFTANAARLLRLVTT